MAESVYKVIELIGTSTESWEKAAKAAVERAAESLRDLRVAEVVGTGSCDHRREGRGVPDQAERVFQVRGVERVRMHVVAWRDCGSLSDRAFPCLPANTAF